MGLGMIVDYFSKCQKAGIRMIAVGAGTRVSEQLRLTKIDTLFPVSADGRETGSGRMGMSGLAVTHQVS
jgi:anti-anti-sigma regulatory factor